AVVLLGLGAVALGRRGAETRTTPSIGVVVSSPPRPPPPRVVVEFVTSPPGAAIRVGDSTLCSPTPCRASLPDEGVTVSAELEGFVATKEKLAPPFPPSVALALASSASDRTP